MHGSYLAVPVAREEATHAVDSERQNRQDPERPGQTQVVDHGVGGERVGEAAEARPRGPDAVGQGAFPGEPLRDETDGAGKEEAHAGAKGDALAEDEMPYLAGEGGTYESSTACLFGCQ